MSTSNTEDELSILDEIDNWYHEHTRHHLVDVDPQVFINLIKPLCIAIDKKVDGITTKAIERFVEGLKKHIGDLHMERVGIPEMENRIAGMEEERRRFSDVINQALEGVKNDNTAI